MKKTFIAVTALLLLTGVGCAWQTNHAETPITPSSSSTTPTIVTTTTTVNAPFPQDILSTYKNYSVRPFDFDTDGQNEYIVYYKESLDPPVDAGIYGTVDWNGAFDVYRQESNTWKIVYTDRGTVGKKGYGVYSIMDEKDFFTPNQTVKNGEKEVLITTHQDGQGAYDNQYILKWDRGALTSTKHVILSPPEPD